MASHEDGGRQPPNPPGMSSSWRAVPEGESARPLTEPLATETSAVRCGGRGGAPEAIVDGSL